MDKLKALEIVNAGLKTDLAEEARKLRQVKGDLKRSKKESVEARAIRRLITGAAKDYTPTPPKWLTRAKSAARWKHGVMMQPNCDWHDGEIVHPDQVGGRNEFNHEILEKRVERITNTTLVFAFDILSSDYPGIVTPLLGDMVSGYIHEELKENCSLRMFPSIMHCADLIIAQLTTYKKHFKKVCVPCVVGNHGRLDKKPRAKFGIIDNADWMVYELVSRHFRSDPNVTIINSDRPFINLRVYNTTYRFEHGNRMRGGTGITGPLTPFSLGEHRARKQSNSMGESFDHLVFGHWHQEAEGLGRNYICCPTLKGYDEYAQQAAYPFGRPSQLWWMTHPEHGITMRAPMYGDEPKVGDPAPWAAIMEG